MAKFNRILSPLLRLHPKYRKSLRLHDLVTPTVNTVSACGDFHPLFERTHLEPGSMVENIRPSVNAISEEVAEAEESEESENDGNEVSRSAPEVKLEDVEPSTGAVPEQVEEYESEDSSSSDYDDVPEEFPYDLARRTHSEMITDYLYVALTNDDRDIAALRTKQCEKFTHVVRIVFDSLSDGITPSSWRIAETRSADGHSELRLPCPAFTLRYGDKLTALNGNQLLAARNYVTKALPKERDDIWTDRGVEFKLSPPDCLNSTVLIVGPPDRSVDVMVIVICYLAFLAVLGAEKTLRGLQRRALAGSYWGGDILGKDSLELADQVSKKKWDW